MIFQTLDDKQECVGVYIDGSLHFHLDKLPEGLSKTWKHVPYLSGMDIEYASLYLEEKKLADVLPEYLLDDWEDVGKKILSFKRSLKISQVDMSENCFFDLAPKRLLVEYCEVKNRITEHVLKNVPRPRRYEFYKQVSLMLAEIENRKVNIDSSKIKSYLKHSKLGNQARSILSCSGHVKYNPFGTKTGRLTTAKNAFPILTLGKEFRFGIKPQNDFFVELDFNGAEVRTLLGLLEKPQPQQDVHKFHNEELLGGCFTRTKAKEAFFAWLYGAKKAVSRDASSRLSKYYRKEDLLTKYWDGKIVTTPYGKRIDCPSEHYALNYLVQSTAAELAIKQALKINYLLNNKSSGSFLAFVIHDAIVLDMKNEDRHLLKYVKKIMGSTNFGEFMVNTKEGNNLGNLRKSNIV